MITKRGAEEVYLQIKNKLKGNGKEIEALIDTLYYTKMVLQLSKDILSIEEGT